MRQEPLRLDRMAVEEVGSHPERLAAAIHDQLGLAAGPVPVEAIAAALDIAEIRIADRRPRGSARHHGGARRRNDLVRAGAPRPRRRFTIAHELGHFLNVWHDMTTPIGFACSATTWHLVARRLRPNTPQHWFQEAEASRFAIELPGAASPHPLKRDPRHPRPRDGSRPPATWTSAGKPARAAGSGSTKSRSRSCSGRTAPSGTWSVRSPSRS